MFKAIVISTILTIVLYVIVYHSICIYMDAKKDQSIQMKYVLLICFYMLFGNEIVKTIVCYIDNYFIV